MFTQILKRSGERAVFDPKKITNAIFEATLACGQANWGKAEELTEMVLKMLKESLKANSTPNVEQIQDIIERVLIENGLAKVAKTYILYRQRRSELRKEKAQVLNKEEIDEVDKKFDVNALRVLASRYLRKNDEGKIVESPKELFLRVTTHTVLPSLFYDKKVYKYGGKGKSDYELEDFEEKKYEGKFSIGKYPLNIYHLNAIKRLYNRFAKDGKLKVSLKEFLGLLKEGYFDKYEKEISEYYDLIVSRKFMPNTPALANFGNSLGMGSACFVLGVEDSIDLIMDSLKSATIIFKSGGGCGYNFSKLRPEGDYVKSTGGIASGPLSFMSMFDNMTDVIKQGGIRRGANMGILNSNHPDIVKFIKAKEGNKALKNFNISVLLMDDFWKYLEKGEQYPLVNPRSGKITAYVDAQQLFDMIAYQAWESAEPGVIFHDAVNKYNPFLKHLGPIITTNPCGEVLLYPNESCNLGSINVWAFVKKENGGKPSIDWEGMKKAVILATRFLDNVTDVNLYPLKEIEETTLFTRKIGLGIMGVGDLLYELDIPYNGKAGQDFMEELMEFINYHSKVQSIELAKERGALPAFNKSFYKEGKLPLSGVEDKKNCRFDWAKISKEIKKNGIRNGYTTVIAPTGSISMIAGCSSGIEPVYSLIFEKNVPVGKFYYVDPVFERKMQEEGLMDSDLVRDVSKNKGTVSNISYISERVKKTFVTAHDISPEDHIKALASFQKWTDSSISKTNNFPADATLDDVKKVYMLAHKLGCKGATIFRDGSITSQVITAGKSEKDKKDKDRSSLVEMKDEKAKGLAVYKEAGAGQSNNGTLGLSPTLMSVKPQEKNGSNGDDVVDPNGAVKCKLCNL